MQTFHTHRILVMFWSIYILGTEKKKLLPNLHCNNVVNMLYKTGLAYYLKQITLKRAKLVYKILQKQVSGKKYKVE